MFRLSLRALRAAGLFLSLIYSLASISFYYCINLSWIATCSRHHLYLPPSHISLPASITLTHTHHLPILSKLVRGVHLRRPRPSFLLCGSVLQWKKADTLGLSIGITLTRHSSRNAPPGTSEAITCIFVPAAAAGTSTSPA